MSSVGNILEAPFRLATPGDLPGLVPLAKSTVPGFVEQLWSRLADDDETADGFGLRAQGAFVAEGQTIVADVGGKIAAMLISYPMADAPNPHVPGMDDMLIPLMKLFSVARGTWYLHGIACAADFMGQGIASRLMHVVEDLGRLAGKSQISLLVIDTNLTAIRFYERRGYDTTATEAVVRNGWETMATEWLLMEKSLV